MSAGLGEEWVYVRFGRSLRIRSRPNFSGLARAAEGSIQVSDDAETWRDLHILAEESAC